MGDFKFNGRWASELGLTVEKIPQQNGPAKRMTSEVVAGRNGNLHLWDGSYENLTVRYQCWFNSSPVSDKAHEIKSWLLSAPVSSELWDTYDMLHYRLATFRGPLTVDNIRDRKGRCIIEFDCAPQMFTSWGTAEVSSAFNTIALDNPTDFPAAPLLRVKGTVSGRVNIGDRNVLIQFLGEEEAEVYIDCYTQEAYELVDGVPTATASAVFTTAFPVLMPGNNTVERTGGITELGVTPRWWTL